MKNKVLKIVNFDFKKKNKFSVNELMVVEAINENIDVLFEGKGEAVVRVNEFMNQEEELKKQLLQVIQFIVNIFVNTTLVTEYNIVLLSSIHHTIESY